MRRCLQGQPQLAFQWFTDPPARRAASEDLWAYYRQEPGGADMLRGFVAEPLVRTLLALGPAAQVRFYETELVHQSNIKERVSLLFAVTFQDQDQNRPTTFLVRFVVERKLADPRGTFFWKIARASLVDTPPDSWPKIADPSAPK